MLANWTANGEDLWDKTDRVSLKDTLLCSSWHCHDPKKDPGSAEPEARNLIGGRKRGQRVDEAEKVSVRNKINIYVP